MVNVWKSSYLDRIKEKSISEIVAFTFNAKSSAITFLVLFLFFPFRHFFWKDCRYLFSKRFIMSYQKSVWPRSDSFLGHIKIFPKKLFLKLQVVIRDACGTWHSLRTVTNIHSIQKNTRNSPARNSEGHLVSECWLKIQSSKQREIELISKNVRRKR